MTMVVFILWDEAAHACRNSVGYLCLILAQTRFFCKDMVKL